MTAGMLTAMIEPHTGTKLGHHELESIVLIVFSIISITIISVIMLLSILS